MIPAVIQGFGSAIYYIRGNSLTPLNATFLSNPAVDEATGGADADRTTQINNFNENFFGGINTFWGGGYANHKPLAFYRGNLYQAPNLVKEGIETLYISRFDGSGIFSHQGSDYATSKWKNGRGSELISPSGTTSTLRSADMGLITYNDHLFIVGASLQSSISPGTNKWVTEFGWDIKSDSFTVNSQVRKTRLYQSFVVNKDDKKFASNRRKFSPDASTSEHTGTCDLIGYNDDLYYANWIDTLRIHGGSGTIELVEQDLSNPSSKSFSIFPASGYNGVTPSGTDSVFMLTGSGVLKRILNPSGTETIVDFSNVRVADFRTGDNFSARINSSQNEPGRSCLLLPFDNSLHAFVPTDASGYMHFSCTSNPRTPNNWTDRTLSLPREVMQFDGNLFGYVDTFRNKIYTSHHTMSEVGVWGYVGLAKGAGSISVNELNVNNVWRGIYKGVVGPTPRGFVPYVNEGPNMAVPSGSNPNFLKCSDYTILTYTLFDHLSRDVDVSVQYSINNGLVWNNASRFRTYDTGVLAGSGLTGLATLPNGIDYEFWWWHVKDLGFNIETDVILRIFPKLSR